MNKATLTRLARATAPLACLLLVAGCGASNVSNATSQTAPTRAEETTIAVDSGIAEMQPCPRYRAATTTGAVADTRLNELSGLAMSVRNPGVMWTHNDSGDSARIFGIEIDGGVRNTVTLESTSVFDAEDIAISHGPNPEVWLADIGDNIGFRPTVELYHFAEPSADADTTVAPEKVTVRYQRPGGNDTYSVDAESFFIDNAGNGYIIEKPRDEKLAWVFKMSASDLRNGKAVAKPIAQITGNTNGRGVGPTAADLNADGTALVVKNYSETFVWRFSSRSSIEAVLKARPTSPCKAVAAGLGEAITFDGRNLVTVEEGVGKPIRLSKAY